MFDRTTTPATANGHELIDRAARHGDAALQGGAETAHRALGSLDTLRDHGRELRLRAQVAGERTVGYIQDEPVKSVLVAAAAGAALMALFSALAGRGGR